MSRKFLPVVPNEPCETYWTAHLINKSRLKKRQRCNVCRIAKTQKNEKKNKTHDERGERKGDANFSFQ